MRRDHGRRAAALALVLALAVPARAAGPAVDPLTGLRRGLASGFNLLIVTLDTTRADRLGCYGYAQAATPTLDRLASEGLRFADAVTPVPLTLAAHSSLFTGNDPPSHGVRNNAEYRLAAERVTLAEVLKSKGYQTAAFVSAFVLDARYGLDQGFDLYDDAVETTRSASFPAGTNERSADAVTDAALRWLDRKPAGRPFFAWLHYFDPHAPYQTHSGSTPGQQPYDGEIAFLDSQLARFLARLEALALRKNTLIVVAGDHGESLGDHGELTHGIFVYDSVMRVPLLLLAPGVRPGVVDDRVVSLIDLLPTVLDLLGVDDLARREGRSLVGARPVKDRAVYLESLSPYYDFGWAPLFALRRHDAKYVQAPRPEYYDLGSDPGEEKNLAGTAAGTAGSAQGRLESDLNTRLTRWPNAVPAAKSAAATIDPEVRERLQALGYAGGAGPAVGGQLLDPKDMVSVSRAIVQANALLAEGRPAQALQVLEAVAKLSPRDRSVLQALGKVYVRLNRLPDAERVLRAFREIQPKSDTSLLLAQILILDGRFLEADRLLDEALALDPRHGGVFIARGDLLARQGQVAAARQSYETAKKLDPYRAAGPAAARIEALSRQPSPKP